MSIFDLIFIAFFLTTGGIFLLVLISALSGQRKFARNIAKLYAVGLVIYAVAVLVSSLLVPRRELLAGHPLCFDDWCISVEGMERTDSVTSSMYTVFLKLSSRARGVTQRENGVVVYLIDENEKRYDPLADNSAVPNNIALDPQEFIETVRYFEVPRSAKISGLIIAHEGGFPIDWFIIGQGPFQKPPVFRLNN